MKILINKKITEVLSESLIDYQIIVDINKLNIEHSFKEIELVTHVGNCIILTKLYS